MTTLLFAGVGLAALAVAADIGAAMAYCVLTAFDWIARDDW